MGIADRNSAPVDPKKLFVRWRGSVVNVATVDGVTAGSHRKGETNFLVYWINDPKAIGDPITGEDADAFAIDFFGATNRDLYAICGVAKPEWVAREMADEGGTLAYYETPPVAGLSIDSRLSHPDAAVGLAALRLARGEVGDLDEGDEVFGERLRRAVYPAAWREDCNQIAG